jgi:transposase
MAKARSLVGLDVHATKIVAAVLDGETGQLQTFAMGGESAAAAAFCAGLAGAVRVTYEAGPTGYRPGMVSRASSPGAVLSVSSRHRARFPARRGTA